MLSLSSQLVRRRILHSLRLNCVKTLQTNATKLEKTLQFNAETGNPNKFNQNLSQLDASLKRFGRITTRDLKQCLVELSESKSIRPTTTQSLLMIRSCGALTSDETPESRQNLCQSLFDTLLEVTDLDISHYNQLLRVFVENKFEFDAINFLEKMQSKGVEPNRVTFMLMIDRFCQNGNLSEAIRILEHMKSKDMAITESVFNSLIIGYGKAGDLETAEQTMDIMRSSGAEPSSDTYTALLCAYAFNSKTPGIEQKFEKLFEEISKTGDELSEVQLLKVFKTLAENDSNLSLADLIIKRIKKSFNYNKECLNVINELMYANKVDFGLRLYETMEPGELQIKQKTVGSGLIRSMVRANIAPEVVIGVCDRLQSEGSNDKAIKTATENALMSADLDHCRTYLKRMAVDNPMRIHYFYPLIVKCETEEQILDVLNTDLASFSGASYSQLIELFVDYVWAKNILDTDSFIERCKSIGFSIIITVNSLIRYYISNERLNEAIQLMTSPIYSSVNLIRRDMVNELTELVLRPESKIDDITKTLRSVHSKQKQFPSESDFTDTFGQFLLTSIRKRLPQSQLTRVLQSFNRMSVRISEVSANAIRDRIRLSDENDRLLTKISIKNLDDNRGVYHDIEDITKPRREMTPEELEGHLIELRSKGLNTRGVLRSLLMSYCRRTRFPDDAEQNPLVNEARKRVHQIMDELRESDFQYSHAMYAMLMEFFANCGDMKAALDMKSKIPEDFEIDWYKVINLATLHVKNGEIEKGIDLIRNENKRRLDTVDGEELNPTFTRSRDMTIYRLLNSLIEANADIKLLKEVFDLCINYSSLTPTSVMAGPLVKYHIIKGDYQGALDQFSECVEKYRITPWKSQLIKHYLETEDQLSLQKVLDYSNKVHGQMNTIMELAAICIEAGKVKQAKKLLDTPGLRVRQPKIDTICEQMVREDKIDALEQLIRLSKSVFDVNRDRMLFHLIRGCIKLGDPQKALNCWTFMQEEDIQPSDNTLILLANFLQQNNISVPFAVPPKAVQSSPKEDFKEQTTKSEDPLNKFNEAIKMSEIDEALRIKNSVEAEGKSLLMSQNCSLIEALLNSNRIDEAFDISKKLLSSKLFPAPRIIRYLNMKLSNSGDYQRLEELRPLLPEFLAQNNSYSNSLASAYINSGKAEEMIDKLPQFKPFPLGAFLRALEVRPDLEQRLIGVANELVRDSDYHLPLNMVWINFMNKGRFEDAKKIYDSCPKLKDFLLFSSLLDSIRESHNVDLAKKLIETVSQSNLTPKSIGVTYSALIDAYIESGEVTAAEDVVLNEVLNTSITRLDPKTGAQVKLGIEHLTRSTFRRLIKSIRDKEQREPKFATNGHAVITSSSDSDLSESSDDEVIDVKNK